MASEYRVDELERRNNNHGRSLSSLSSRLAAVEQLANMLAGGVGGWPQPGGGSIRVGRVTGSVSASTGTTPGFGTAQLLKLDGSGDYQDDGSPVSVYNAGAAIASPKRVFVVTDPAGNRWATPEEC